VIDKTGRNSIVISSKDNTITVLADKDLIIDVKGNIDMKAGGNITMKATGNIQGQGTNVELKANASGKFEASATLDLKGAILNAEAQATATLKGALVNVQGSGPVKVAGTPIMLN
jgi:type VI secretion system secreted protein VgrG